MIEQRWKVEQWEEYALDSNIPRHKSTEPVLQNRVMIGPKGAKRWSEWQDVPTEYISDE